MKMTRPVIVAACVGLVTVLVVAQEAGPIDWKSFPSAVRRAKAQYDNDLERADDDYAQAIEEVQAQRQEDREAAQVKLTAVIDSAIKQAMKAEDLDQAVALKDAKESLAGESPQTEEDVVSRLVGTWKVFDDNSKWRSELVFTKDGRVEGGAGGKWTIRDGYVLAVFANTIPGYNGIRYWHTLNLPLDPKGVTGDSWSGKGGFHAVKVK